MLLPLFLLPLGLLFDELAPAAEPVDPATVVAASEEAKNRELAQTGLTTDATDAALDRLMKDGTPLMRVDAYRQFVERSGRVYLRALLAHLGDNDEVDRHTGCIVMTSLVGDELLSVSWSRLSPDDRRRVRAAVYEAPVPLVHRLMVAQDDPELGTPALEAARRDSRLLRVLAERRFAAVIPLVIEALGDAERRADAMNAVAEWPVDSFLGPFRGAAEGALREGTSTALEAYYRAAVAWPARQALPLLERAFNERDRRYAHLILAARALGQRSERAFDSVRWKLAAEGVPDEPLLCFLTTHARSRLEAVATSLVNSGKVQGWDLEVWQDAAAGDACGRLGAKYH